jgi:hypothetical protein
MQIRPILATSRTNVENGSVCLRWIEIIREIFVDLGKTEVQREYIHKINLLTQHTPYTYSSAKKVTVQCENPPHSSAAVD